MKVLILGGTGAIGKHLVELLASAGYEVCVTSRRSRVSEGNIEYLQGDAHDLGFLNSILKQDWDAIVDFMIYSEASFAMRVERLLDATTQYLYLSSARVYADSKQPIKETSARLLDVSNDTNYLKTHEYALDKARQEDALRKSGREKWTIIRPYITYSENRLQLGVLEKEEWLYRALKGRTIVFSRDICSKITTLTYGLDVAKCVVATIGQSEAMGQVFHPTAAGTCKWSEVLSVYLNELEKHLGVKPQVLLQDLPAFMGWKKTEYQIRYDRLFDRKFDNSKICELVNRDSLISYEPGLTSCVRAFLQNPSFSYINWKAEAFNDRSTGELASLSEIRGIRTKIRYLIYRFLISPEFQTKYAPVWRNCKSCLSKLK